MLGMPQQKIGIWHLFLSRSVILLNLSLTALGQLAKLFCWTKSHKKLLGKNVKNTYSCKVILETIIMYFR
jgi:hypothetical protein